MTKNNENKIKLCIYTHTNWISRKKLVTPLNTGVNIDTWN